jgi:hypothetical protein
MATSGQYTFTVTRDTVIRNAMLNIGKLGDTETPTPQETTDCSTFLNMMVRQWMGRQDFAPGLKMWSRYRGDLLLSSTKGIYTLSPTGDNWAAGVALPLNPNEPNLNETNTLTATIVGATALFVSLAAAAGFSVNDFVVVQNANGDITSTTCSAVNLGTGQITVPALPVATAAGAEIWNYTTKGQPLLEINSAILRDSQDNDTPLNYMTLQEYEALPTKVQPGYISDPQAIYHEPQLIGATGLRSSTLYLDVSGAQDVTKQIHIVGFRPLQSFVNPLDNADFPEDWELPLSLGLSRLICPMFEAVWTKEMDENLTMALAIARETTPETSVAYFQCHADDP